MKNVSRTLSLTLLGITAFTSCSKYNGEQVTHTAYFSPYGPEIDKKSFEEQGYTGEVVERLQNGCSVRTAYLEGKLHGTSSVTFPNSPVVHTYEEYLKGKLVSRGVNFDSGVPEFEEEFTARGTRLVTCWYYDGSPKIMEEWVDAKLLSGTYLTVDGEEESRVEKGTGIRIERDPTGVLLSRDHVEEGLILSRELLFPSGMVSESIELKDGIRDGVTKVFLESGAPLRIESWSQGKLQGTQIHFENGLKSSEVPYLMGSKHGVERCYIPGTATIIQEKSWSRDKLHGPSTTYMPPQGDIGDSSNPQKTEKVLSREWYWNGEAVTEETFALRTVRTGRPRNVASQ